MSTKNHNLPQRTKWFLEPLGSFGPLNYSIAVIVIVIVIQGVPKKVGINDLVWFDYDLVDFDCVIWP